MLPGPIRFTPEKGGSLVYRFEGEVAMDRLFSGIAGLAPFMASPTGSAIDYTEILKRIGAPTGLHRLPLVAEKRPIPLEKANPRACMRSG